MSWQSAATTLRWSSDGRQLAFAWNVSALRVLGTSAPDGNLLTISSQLAVNGTTYASLGNFICSAAQGWHPITITRGSGTGQGVVCAGSTQSNVSTPCASPAGPTCQYTQRNSIGFLRATHDSQGDGYEGLDVGSSCASPDQPGSGAYLGWSNSDGSELVGAEVCGGKSRFGVFHGTEFTPLPAPPVSLPAALTGGTIAW